MFKTKSILHTVLMCLGNKMFETSLSGGLGLIWYGMMWFCRYFDKFGYSKNDFSVWPSYLILN